MCWSYFSNVCSNSGQAPRKPVPDSGPPKLLDEYTLGKVLGQGAFGIVYKCTSRATKEEFAVKMVDKVETPLEAIQKESDMLFKLAHENVVKLHAVFNEKVFVCMVMSIYHGGDLIEGMQAHWQTKGMIPPQSNKHLVKQIIASLAFLHSQKVCHRDVKGDNFLTDRKDIVDLSCKVYLSDFGTVVECNPEERQSAHVGTKVYWSPEVYAKDYGPKADCWAMGVIFYGLVEGKFPFKGKADVKVKTIKLPSRCPKDNQDLIHKMLHKVEKERPDSKSAMQHPWIASSGTEAAVPFAAEPGFTPEIREVGANAGIDERRKELVERLQVANAKKTRRPTNPNSTLPQDFFHNKFFELRNKPLEKTIRYAWRPDASSGAPRRGMSGHDFLDLSGARLATADDNGSKVESTEVIEAMLKEHGINPANFGKGQFKTLFDFAQEIQLGTCRLMLNATEHKKMVRVVDVVLLRLTHGSGSNTKYLIQNEERSSDGRNKKSDQMPGTKKEPHENLSQVAHRILVDRLKIDPKNVSIRYKREYFEEEDESLSYPGVKTVYRKEILEGELKLTTPPGTKTKTGLSYEVQDARKMIRVHEWLSEKQCEAKRVKLRASEEGAEVSPLIQACCPVELGATPDGYEEDELIHYLETNGVPPAKFGTENFGTLQQFATELVKGEAHLQKTSSGAIKRVVDIIILELKAPNGEILIETEEVAFKGGAPVSLNRLPAVKRRPDENQFVALQRLITKDLQMDANWVTIDNTNVRIVEETKSSVTYPGLETEYRKRVLSALLSPLQVKTKAQRMKTLFGQE